MGVHNSHAFRESNLSLSSKFQDLPLKYIKAIDTTGKRDAFLKRASLNTPLFQILYLLKK